jgi:hypothetical protein
MWALPWSLQTRTFSFLFRDHEHPWSMKYWMIWQVWIPLFGAQPFWLCPGCDVAWVTAVFGMPLPSAKSIEDVAPAARLWRRNTLSVHCSLQLLGNSAIWGQSRLLNLISHWAWKLAVRLTSFGNWPSEHIRAIYFYSKHCYCIKGTIVSFICLCFDVVSFLRMTARQCFGVYNLLGMPPSKKHEIRACPKSPEIQTGQRKHEWLLKNHRIISYPPLQL